MVHSSGKHCGQLCCGGKTFAVFVQEHVFGHFYIEHCSLLLSRLAVLLSHVIVKKMTVALYSMFLNIHCSGVSTALFGCYMAGAM